MRKFLTALILACAASWTSAQEYSSAKADFSVPKNGGTVVSSGSVSSIDCTGNAVMNCLGGPITTSGTFTLGLQTQSANMFFLGPTSGAAAVPTFRAITPADIAVGTNGECLSILSYAGGTFDWITCGGGGLSDGDKGDVTVSSSGAVWNIDAGVVGSPELATLAKTRTVLLIPETAAFPASNFPTLNVLQGTNFPVSTLDYADAATQTAYWKLDPDKYAGGTVTVTIFWYANTSTATMDVEFAVKLAAITPNTDSGSTEAKAFATETTGTDQIIGATAKRLHSFDISVTTNLDSLTAGDMLWLGLARNGSSGSDDLTVNASVVGVRVSWLETY